ASTAAATASSSPAASATSTAPSSAATATTSAGANGSLPRAAADRPQVEDGSDEGSRGEMHSGTGQASSLAPRGPCDRPEPLGGRGAAPRNAGQPSRRPLIAAKKPGRRLKKTRNENTFGAPAG